MRIDKCDKATLIGLSEEEEKSHPIGHSGDLEIILSIRLKCVFRTQKNLPQAGYRLEVTN
jgi:hypothetical protein